MKVLLEINDSKAAFIMELLENFKFVKAKPLTPYIAEILDHLRHAVQEVNEGRKKTKNYRGFFCVNFWGDSLGSCG